MMAQARVSYIWLSSNVTLKRSNFQRSSSTGFYFFWIYYTVTQINFKNLRERMILLKGLCAELLSTPSSVGFLGHIRCIKNTWSTGFKMQIPGAWPQIIWFEVMNLHFKQALQVILIQVSLKNKTKKTKNTDLQNVQPACYLISLKYQMPRFLDKISKILKLGKFYLDCKSKHWFHLLH